VRKGQKGGPGGACAYVWALILHRGWVQTLCTGLVRVIHVDSGVERQIASPCSPHTLVSQPPRNTAIFLQLSQPAVGTTLRTWSSSACNRGASWCDSAVQRRVGGRGWSLEVSVPTDLLYRAGRREYGPTWTKVRTLDAAFGCLTLRERRGVVNVQEALLAPGAGCICGASESVSDVLRSVLLLFSCVHGKSVTSSTQHTHIHGNTLVMNVPDSPRRFRYIKITVYDICLV
jgi:hypothetical protein